MSGQKKNILFRKLCNTFFNFIRISFKFPRQLKIIDQSVNSYQQKKSLNSTVHNEFQYKIETVL